MRDGDGDGDGDGTLSRCAGYRLEIGNDNTAVVFDELGSAIVTVHFDDYEELCSESFRHYLEQAVATVTGQGVVDVFPSFQDTSQQKGGLKHLDHEVDAEGIEAFLATWQEEEGSGGGDHHGDHSFWDEEFMQEHQRQQQYDQDYALACALQEEEDEENEKSLRLACPSFIPESEFPPLAFPKSSQLSSHPEIGKNNNGQTLSFSKRNKRLTTSDDLPMELFGYVRPVDELSKRSQQFLDEGRGDLRGVALQYTQVQDDVGDDEVTRKGKTLSRTGQKSSFSRFSQKGKDKPQHQMNAEQVEYSRKSMRKLVRDMLLAGWHPLKGRGGGHYVYERRVKPKPNESDDYKQLIVLPSTPSDRKWIDAVYARLLRADREAALLCGKG